MDVTKLTPAPWYAAKGSDEVWHDTSDRSWFVCDAGHNETVKIGNAEAEAEFIALARNAFDIMMRRGWWSYLCKDGLWRYSVVLKLERPADLIGGLEGIHLVGYSDPFTAIVEADKWYRETIECEKPAPQIKE